MNKQMIAGMITVLLIFSSCPSFAAGITVVDTSSIAKLVVNAQQQAKEALAQLNKAKEAIAQAKNQYEGYKNLVEGNSNLGDFLNDPTLNKILPLSGWQDIYQDAKRVPALRDQYGLVSSDSAIQKQFDKLLQQAGVMEDAYNASSQRVKNADSIRKLLNTADTPQKKEDLQLRYQQEMLEIQNQTARLQQIKMLMDEKEKIESEKKSQAFKDYMNGKKH